MIKLLRSGLRVGQYYFSGNQVQREAVARNETSVFFESVTSTVKGYLNPNYIV